MFLKFDVYQEKIFLQIPQNKTGAPQNKRGTVICSNHCKEKETSQTNYQYLASTTHIWPIFQFFFYSGIELANKIN